MTLHPLTLAQRESLARELAADPNNFEHIVRIEETYFTLQHPLTERNESLFDCDLHSQFAALDGPPREPGDYRVVFNDNGGWSLEPLK